MIPTITLLLVLAGFMLLLLAMAKHQQDWLGRKLPAKKSTTLRRAGFGAIILAFIANVAGLGWGYGAIAWFGWMTFAALLVVTANCNRIAIQRCFGKDAR